MVSHAFVFPHHFGWQIFFMQFFTACAVLPVLANYSAYIHEKEHFKKFVFDCMQLIIGCQEQVPAFVHHSMQQQYYESHFVKTCKLSRTMLLRLFPIISDWYLFSFLLLYAIDDW